MQQIRNKKQTAGKTANRCGMDTYFPKNIDDKHGEHCGENTKRHQYYPNGHSYFPKQINAHQIRNNGYNINNMPLFSFFNFEAVDIVCFV